MTEGLQSVNSDGETVFLFDGLPVGRIHWDHTNWVWSYLYPDGEAYGYEPINADPESSSEFISERQRIALKDPSVVAVLMAELDGRLRLFRDETEPMALMFGRSKARRVGMERRSAREV